MGALTLLVAGLVALVQTDIKRVIAYSTMSQIGYMFLGAGVGAYANGDVPPDDARVLQGAALHGRRPRHPRARRRAGHPEDGRHRQADAVDEVDVPRRVARARRHLPVRRLLLEGLDHRRDAQHRLVRLRLLGRRADRHVPHRPLHVPPLLHRLPRRAERVRRGAPPRPSRPRGPVDDAHPGRRADRAVGRRRLDPVLAVLASRSPTGSSPSRARSASPSRRTRRSGSRPASRSALGLAGIGVAYAIYGTGRLAVPKLPAVQRALEHKLYFDEAYDAVFYKPAAAARRAAAPRRRGAVRARRRARPRRDRRSTPARAVRRLQTGMLRTYVFFLGMGMAVLAVVFLVVR